jgi:hypothetical protein
MEDGGTESTEEADSEEKQRGLLSLMRSQTWNGDRKVRP